MRITNELQATIKRITAGTEPVSWSICTRLQTGDVVAGHNADVRLRAASVGKLLLLAEVARQLEEGLLSGGTCLLKTSELAVADSGLWQNLKAESFSIEDLAVLISSVSDNLATNVLINHIGLEKVTELGKRLDLSQTALLDRVRSWRGPGHAPTLSVGSASELSFFMGQMTSGVLISPGVSQRLRRWLMTSVDFSMVASAFGLDPLSHAVPDRGFTVCNKTGTDTTIRADVGSVSGPGGTMSYAMIANWQQEAGDLRDDVLRAMGQLGTTLRAALAV